jgi:hypothetical protein
MTQQTDPDIPQYLLQPIPLGGETFGTLTYCVSTKQYGIDAPPYVLQLAKRLFPGSGRKGRLMFQANQRQVADLNWLMLRYPLKVECPDQFQADRAMAVQHAHKRLKGVDMLEADIPTSFRGVLKPFQASGVSFLLENQRALLGDEMGCVEGEAELLCNRAGKSFKITIRDAYRRLNGLDNHYPWNPDIPTKVHAYCDTAKEFRQHTVRHIISKGIKAVWKVTLESGKSVRLTPDHEVLRERGEWVATSDLKAGDKIYTRGRVCFLPKVDVVATAKPDGDAEVYDIVMHDPMRTFVANGVVLHNCGKTVTALAAIAKANAFPVLVVCPASIQRQWARQAAAFLDLPGGLLVPDPEGSSLCHRIKGTKPYDLPAKPIYITHYGLLSHWQKYFQEHIKFKAIVFDEIQELRHTGTRKYSAASLMSDSSPLIWGLSGTPIYNYGGEIWAILNILDLHCLGDWESFSREWCTGYGTQVIAEPEVLGDLLKREGLMLRRRKSEVLSQLPPKRRIVVDLDHDQSQWNALIKEAIQLAHKYDTSSFTDKGLISREIDTQLRRASGLLKAPLVAEFVNSLIESGEKVLLYAYHHDVHDILMKKLARHNPVKITGRETQAQKDESVRLFSEGRTNLVELSLRTVAGLDGLQGRGTCVVFPELDWSPAVHSQCEDRLHRMGFDLGKESLLCYYMVNQTEIDQEQLSKLGLKTSQFIGIMSDPVHTAEDADLDAAGAHKHLMTIIDRLKQHSVKESDKSL